MEDIARLGTIVYVVPMFYLLCQIYFEMFQKGW